jgi:hypothetical protein
MEEIVKERRVVDVASQLIANRVLDLVYKKKYDCVVAAEALKIDVAELRLKLREELKLYRNK